MAKWTKAKRSAAAKKAARTRKVKNQKTEAKRKKVAKKAKAAGTDSEVGFKRKLERKGNLVLNGKGIPDIIAKKGKRWTFYEIKPHQVRRGYDNKGSWKTVGDKSRLLRKNQYKEFKNLVQKGVDVYMVYYYRKRRGTKTNPIYKFKYSEIKLSRRDFRNKIGPDPDEFEIPEEIQRWKAVRTF